jgi:transcriptional regulator with XRE-family HTH domain
MMYKNPGPLELQLSRAVVFWRRLDGRSQRDLGESMGLPRQYLSRIENAHTLPNLNTFLRLAAALNVSPYILALTMEAL